LQDKNVTIETFVMDWLAVLPENTSSHTLILASNVSEIFSQPNSATNDPSSPSIHHAFPGDLSRPTQILCRLFINCLLPINYFIYFPS
jgi:hypothetical protein